jgi:hypothetical protein
MELKKMWLKLAWSRGAKIIPGRPHILLGTIPSKRILLLIQLLIK